MDFEYLTRMVAMGNAVDWVVVFMFALVAVIYFLVPVLGYSGEKRGLLLASLYLLVAYAVLVLLQLVLSYLLYLASSRADSSPKPTLHLTYLFGILKLLVFVASQAVFVFGLQGLRRGSTVGTG